MTIYIGISGWRYAGWRAVFYPKGLAQAREPIRNLRSIDGPNAFSGMVER